MNYRRQPRLHRQRRIGVLIDDRYVTRLIKQGYTIQQASSFLFMRAMDKWLHAPEASIAQRKPRELILPRKIWFEQWNKDG